MCNQCKNQAVIQNINVKHAKTCKTCKNNMTRKIKNAKKNTK